jgi:hypothetical protein
MKYVSLPDMQFLMGGLSLNVKRCADVLEAVLAAFNEQTTIPEQILSWNAKGGNSYQPLSFPARGRFIVDLTQSLLSNGKNLWTASLVEKSDEKEKAPVLFISMHSPSLDIPMRLEIPLRAVMQGGPPLKGTYSVYLHSLLTDDDGREFVYYGITKRGWNIRFSEHTKAAVRKHSYRLFPRTLNSLIEARAEQIRGKIDNRPRLTGIISALCGVGLGQDSAMDIEEYLVEKYSLSSKHSCGLNMIPGGRAGVSALRRLHLVNKEDCLETEQRESRLDRYLRRDPKQSMPRPGIVEKWNDPKFAEAVICGRENRLQGDQVLEIRYLAALGASPEQIKEQIDAIDEDQIRRVLAGRTYSRIR